MSAPFEDLLKDSSQSFEDGNYFLVTITELELGSIYPIQLRWKYKDGTFGKDWSASYDLNTPIKTNPADPSLPSNNVVGGAGFIKVTWDGNDASNNPLQNIDRVDIHISGSSFGDGTKPSGSFKVAGTQTFTAEPGVYIVQLKAVTVNGATSFFSTARTVTVTAIGEVVQTPTLPSGLSVATAPFAVTVNWAGTYSSSTFTGFKSIDIYAVGSDLGASTTSGITNTNLVGSLTVNNTPNKINISLDNLRQALSLTNNSDVYNATIFYYFNATNRDGTKFGSPTYTRINASSVVPTKANFIDLASGVISIENLVAGNGTFSSWLRTGPAGGARIELSAVSDFVNGGNTVQKGLVAYSSGNTEIFNLDIDAGTLTINGSGTFTGDLLVGTGDSTFGSDSNGIWLGRSSFSAASDRFRVSRSGFLTAASGTIGGLVLSSNSLANSLNTFSLDSGGKARFGSSTGNAIIIDPTGGIYHTTNGNAANGTFSITTGGVLTASSGTIAGWSISTNSISKGTTSLSASGTNGSITTNTGTIGGWTIANNGMTSSNVELLSSNYLTGNSSGAIKLKGTFREYSFFAFDSDFGISDTTGGFVSSVVYYQQANDRLGVTNLWANSVTSGAYNSTESSTQAGTHLGSDGVIQARRSGNTPMFSHRTDGNGRVITFFLAGTGGGGINATAGGTPTFAAASDYRLKENIVDYINASDRIKAARLRKFNLKEIPEKEFIGFIAHEFSEVDPEFVIGEKDAVDEDGNPIYQEIQPTNMIYYLTGALKESILKIEELEQRLDALEG